MLKKRIIASTLSLLLLSPLAQISNLPSVQAATSSKNIIRVQGTNRFKTSIAIADKVVSDATLDNVVLTSGYDFPDGLSGSTLAKKLNAPILMAGNLSDSQDALNYIYAHLKQNGNVYILGGTGAVSKDTEETLKNKGYIVTRLAGQDRIGTNTSITESLNTPEGTPVFIANAYSFPDALSVSSIAAINGYPILLTSTNTISSSIKDDLSKIKPSTVYIVGGTGVVSSDVENSIKALLPSSSIQRISGANRFETSMNVFTKFNLDTTNVVLASGLDFPDALSGSQLAAKLNASIVLADENNLDAQQVNYTNKGITDFYILGGTGAVSGGAEETINFDKDVEKANITSLLNTYSNAISQENIDLLMSTIYKNSSAYDQMKSFYEQHFAMEDEGNFKVTLSIESFDFNSFTHNIADINVSEKAVRINNDGSTISKTGTERLLLVKDNGKWYVVGSVIKS
ncbi:MAG: cell wall-binding repeat-containing protein [Bacillota bacterium]|nr:cell wall-binding repeat-containing protein [Bacillota bacterium]